MENQKQDNALSSNCKVIHVKVVGGNTADIYEIGQAMRKLKENLPYRLEAIVTTDKVELQDVNVLVDELVKLKKQLDRESKLKGN